MTQTLRAVQFDTRLPTPQMPGTRGPAPVRRERWVEVVSHLHPRYGGLSSAVPALSRSLAAVPGKVALQVDLAAFCAADEQFNPVGVAPNRISFWPVSRKPWLRDRFAGQSLQRGLGEQLRGASGVHIHGLWEQSTAIAADLARTHKLPYILSAHGMLEPWALNHKRLKKLLYGLLVERKNVAGAKCLHALTQTEARQYRDFGARSPIAVIPNGVDCPAHTDPALFTSSFPALEGKRMILFMARLHPKKGLDLLLQAWAALAPQTPDAHLVLAGPDSEGTRARLQKFVSDRGLGGSVLFAGMLQGAMKWSALAAAEAFVLPSYSEGLSMGVLEAMGMGVPVLVSAPCNMPEVEQYRAGWQIEPTLEHLTQALGALLSNDPTQNAKIGTCGLELVRTQYTWPIVARKMAELYHWAGGGPAPVSFELAFPD